MYSRRAYENDEDVGLRGAASRAKEKVENAASRIAGLPVTAAADAILAAEVVRGHHDAMTILFGRYEGIVFHIARRWLGDEGEAEDVRQQVYMEAFRDIEQFDPHKGAFKSWLLTRALHRTINRGKHLEAKERRGSADIQEHSSDPASEGNKTRLRLWPAELSQLTTELLAALEPRERQVIMLTFYQSLTREEVATELGATVSAVRHSLQKGLKILYSILATFGDHSHGKGNDKFVG